MSPIRKRSFEVELKIVAPTNWDQDKSQPRLLPLSSRERGPPSLPGPDLELASLTAARCNSRPPLSLSLKLSYLSLSEADLVLRTSLFLRSELELPSLPAANHRLPLDLVPNFCTDLVRNFRNGRLLLSSPPPSRPRNLPLNLARTFWTSSSPLDLWGAPIWTSSPPSRSRAALWIGTPFLVHNHMWACLWAMMTLPEPYTLPLQDLLLLCNRLMLFLWMLSYTFGCYHMFCGCFKRLGYSFSLRTLCMAVKWMVVPVCAISLYI